MLHSNNFSREQQIIILRMFNELSSEKKKRTLEQQWVNDNGLRLIQIALCLFYMNRQEHKFIEITVASMVKDLTGLDKNHAIQIITQDCERIKEEREDFWEETDQGNRNIYYSPHKIELPRFREYIFAKIEDSYVSV